MQNPPQARRIALLLLLQVPSALALIPKALAKLTFTEIKGLQNHIKLKSEFAYLDPILAFNLQRQNFLINLVNYPIEDETGKLDPIAQWIGSTFNAPNATDSPAFLQVSPLSKNFGHFLAPTSIGVILNQLTAMPNSEKEKLRASPDDLNRFKIALIKEIEAETNFQKNVEESEQISQSYDTLVKNLELPHLKKEEEAKLNRLKKQILDNLKKHLGEPLKLLQLRSQLKAIENELSLFHNQISSELAQTHELPEFKSARQKRAQFAYGKNYIKHFINKLCEAWLAEDSEQFLKEKGYPSHIVEQSLVSLAWMNTTDGHKADFVALYKEIPHLLQDDKFPEDENWLSDSYNEKTYVKKAKVLNGMGQAERARYLLDNPEEAAFLSHGQKFFDLKSLPEIVFKNVTYQSKSQDKVEFADCMEASILNFLAITLRNPKTARFDPKIIYKNLIINNLQIEPDFLEFTKHYSDLSQFEFIHAHQDWVESLSGLQKTGIKYVHSGFEMDTRVSNIFNSIDHLLFNPISIEKDSSRRLKDLDTNQEKMDQLCRLLSSEQRDFKWSIPEGNKSDLNNKDTDLTIEFTLNGKTYFNWILSSHHSEIRITQEKLDFVNTDWTSGITEALISIIDPNSDLQLQTLLGVMEPSEHTNSVIRAFGKNKKVLRSLNLDSNESKAKIYEQTVISNLDSIHEVAPFLEKIEKSIFETHPNIKKRLSVFNAKYDYPLGVPSHAIGQPNVKYIRISDSPQFQTDLIAHSLAPDMNGSSLNSNKQKEFIEAFKTAWMDPRGVIWGDLVHDQDGNYEVRGNYHQAKAYCESIHARLPTTDDWNSLARDLGRETPMGYIPQFLGKSYAQCWVGLTTHDEKQGQIFSSYEGTIQNTEVDRSHSVRCVL